MKYLLPFALMLISIFVDLNLYANDCTTTAVVNLCPGAVYNAESTTGQVNDRNSWQFSAVSTVYNAIGNDKVYEVNVPVGSINLWIDVNSTSPLYVITTTTCTQTYFSTLNSYSAGCNRTNISVVGMTKIFVWLDHNNGVDINYDISFSAVSSAQFLNKGTINTSYFCESPIFKPDFGLKYNAVQMPYPLTYNPLNAVGESCYQIFLSNTTGIEAVKKVVFSFGPNLLNPQPSATSTPGFYATGNWIASKPTSSSIQYDFVAGNGRGDFDGLATTCHLYQFCFTFTPTSNNPSFTTVTYNWTGDGYGNVMVYNGCFSALCSSTLTCTSSNCTQASASGPSTGIGTSVDPALAEDILNFNVKREKEFNLLSWSVTQEQKIAMFDVESSDDGNSFKVIGKVASGVTIEDQVKYIFEDKDIAKAFYRLRQEDQNGLVRYSEILSLLFSGNEANIALHPNPAKDLVTIRSTEPITEINICSIHGELLKKENYYNNELSIALSLTNIGKGVYFIKILTGNSSTIKKIIME